MEDPPRELPLVDVMEEVDRLRLENLQLRAMNASRRRDAMLREARDAEVQLAELHHAYSTMLAELGAKYRFNPLTDEMEAGTGVIRHNVRPPPPV
jgi:hypothetical protein